MNDTKGTFQNNDLMITSPNYYVQKHVYTDRGQRLEQVTDKTGGNSGNGGLIRLLYVHEDVMGSTRYHTKDNGQSYAELEYDMWSAPTSPNMLLNNDNGVFIFAQFSGHQYDTVLDIYFAEARFYDAKNRQWMSSDPVKDGLNWYQYVRGNPVTFVDPWGLEVAVVAVNGVRMRIDTSKSADVQKLLRTYDDSARRENPFLQEISACNFQTKTVARVKYGRDVTIGGAEAEVTLKR